MDPCSSSPYITHYSSFHLFFPASQREVELVPRAQGLGLGLGMQGLRARFVSLGFQS